MSIVKLDWLQGKNTGNQGNQGNIGNRGISLFKTSCSVLILVIKVMLVILLMCIVKSICLSNKTMSLTNNEKTMLVWKHWGTRGKKVQSRREREIWKNILQFREEKEKGISFLKVREEKEKFFKWFSTFEKRKRKGFHFLEIREENEKFKIQILQIWNKFQIR